MKKLLHLLFIGAMISCAQAQDFEQTERQEIKITSTQTTLAVYNISGSVRVEGYAGDKVLIEVHKTIKANKSNGLELAREEFKLGTVYKNDTLTLFTAAPYDTRPYTKKHKSGFSEERNGYSVKLDYAIKVPHGVNLKLSTINDGNIEVNKVEGKIVGRNINGNIVVKDAMQESDLNTINGNIIIDYSKAPPSGSVYHTINGKIEAAYPADLNGSIKLKSMNGSFYTDFPETELNPVVTKKDNVYKIGGGTQLKIGNGGTQMRFETLNGDIYIKRKAK